jgi:UDP-galactopyranose mutase
MDKKEHYDFLIIGSGLYGAFFNYLAKKCGKTCLILEKRPHIGGNLYTPIKDNIPIHAYGAHIFHTDDKLLWDFVSNMCGEMIPFVNSPIANYKGEIYNLPFNMNTFSKMFDESDPNKVKQIIQKEIHEINKSGIIEPTNLEEQAKLLVGNTIYTKLIKDYTEKQWGRSCNQLDKDIIKRLPIRYTYDNNYFNDKYQGIPLDGYNKLIENLIGDTEVRLNVDYNNDDVVLEYENKYDYLIYTGPIDAYFNYRYGALEWRSVKFDIEKLNTSNYQGNAVVNYTSHNEPYTRIIEHKFFNIHKKETINSDITYISKEYSIEWTGNCDPYYPINNEKNNEILNKYLDCAKQHKSLLIAGRLGKYKYFDMDDTLIECLKDFDNFCKLNNIDTGYDNVFNMLKY